MCGCFKNIQPVEVVSGEMTTTSHFLRRKEYLLCTQDPFEENHGSSKSSTSLFFKSNTQCQGYFSNVITLIKDQ